MTRQPHRLWSPMSLISPKRTWMAASTSAVIVGIAPNGGGPLPSPPPEEEEEEEEEEAWWAPLAPAPAAAADASLWLSLVVVVGERRGGGGAFGAPLSGWVLFGCGYRRHGGLWFVLGGRSIGRFVPVPEPPPYRRHIASFLPTPHT